MSIEAKLRQAMREKKVVVARYKGGGRRWMCPHVLGTKEGKWHCLFYQFKGESQKGLSGGRAAGNWRCLDITLLSDVSVEEGEWHTGPASSRPQQCIDVIHKEV